MRSFCATLGVLSTLEWRTASLVEILWTLIGLAGVAITWGNLRDVKKSLEALRGVHPEGEVKARTAVLIIATGHYRNELIRTAVFSSISGMGVIAMLAPPLHPHTHPTVTSIAITMCFFMMTILLVMASALDKRQRAILLDLIDVH